MARVEHDLSDEQWTSLVEAWGACAYCGAAGTPLQRDCVLAISRGGRYTLDNVVPACRSCNTSKCNQEVTTWLRRKRLDERAFLLRHVEIRALLVQSPGAGGDRVGGSGVHQSVGSDGLVHTRPTQRGATSSAARCTWSR